MSREIIQRVGAALQRNTGQVLTLDLIAGIMHNVTGVSKPIDCSELSSEQHGEYILAAERYPFVLSELMPLSADFYYEMYGEHEGEEELNSQLAEYNAGRLVLFTCRHEGRMVGFVVVKVYTSTRSGHRVAQDDGLYIVPAHRGTLLALAFTRYVHNIAEQFGVSELRTTAPYDSRAQALSKRLGFTPTSVFFTKKIEADHG